MPNCCDFWGCQGEQHSLCSFYPITVKTTLSWMWCIAWGNRWSIYSVSLFHSAETQDMIKKDDEKDMEGFSFHSIENAFWNILFGGNGYGMYWHCISEQLYSIKGGLFTLPLTGLVDQQSGKKSSCRAWLASKKCKALQKSEWWQLSIHEHSIWIL